MIASRLVSAAGRKLCNVRIDPFAFFLANHLVGDSQLSVMQSLLISLSLSLAVAQNLFQDLTAPVDTGSGVVEIPNLDSGDPRPNPNPNPLNLLAYNSEAPKSDSNAVAIPGSDNNNGATNSNPPDFLFYNSDIVHDLTNSPVIPETYSNGPFSSPDALQPNLEAYRVTAPDFNLADTLESPNSAAQVEKSSNSGSDDNLLVAQSRGCPPDQRAASGGKQMKLECIPETEEERKQREAAEKDYGWLIDNPDIRTVPDRIRSKCKRLGDLLEKSLIAVCCLGPGHRIGGVSMAGVTAFITNEELCGIWLDGRPACLGGPASPADAVFEFCCERLGPPVLLTLGWGVYCLPMAVAPDG